MHFRGIRLIGWAGLVTLAVLLVWRPATQGYEALLVLADINAASTPSHLKDITPPPTRTPVSYSIAGRAHHGDLYLPSDDAPAAGIVLVPGVVPEGKNDPRLINLAFTLARARFSVLVPEMPGFRGMRVRPSDAREVADAISHLVHHRDLAPQGRVGVIAFSYAVGLAVLAGLEEDVRDKIRFIVGVGGYHDLVRVITFFSTGYFQERGQWQHMQPNPYGKWVFVNSSEDYLNSPQDRAVLTEMVRIKLRDMRVDISHLAPQLGPEGRAIYDLLANTDPARVTSLIATLPAPIRADITGLTLTDKDLTRLRAHLWLIADRNDNIIPYTESIALAHAVPETQASLALVGSLIHVEPKGWRYFSWEFWRRDLPDFWHMYRVVYSLLGEQDGE